MTEPDATGFLACGSGGREGPKAERSQPGEEAAAVLWAGESAAGADSEMARVDRTGYRAYRGQVHAARALVCISNRGGIVGWFHRRDAQPPRRVGELAAAVPSPVRTAAYTPAGGDLGVIPVGALRAVSTRLSGRVGQPGRGAQPIFWPLMPIGTWSRVPRPASGPAADASGMRHPGESGAIAADTTAPELGGGSGRGRR